MASESDWWRPRHAPLPPSLPPPPQSQPQPQLQSPQQQQPPRPAAPKLAPWAPRILQRPPSGVTAPAGPQLGAESWPLVGTSAAPAGNPVQHTRSEQPAPPPPAVPRAPPAQEQLPRPGPAWPILRHPAAAAPPKANAQPALLASSAAPAPPPPPATAQRVSHKPKPTQPSLADFMVFTPAAAKPAPRPQRARTSGHSKAAKSALATRKTSAGGRVKVKENPNRLDTSVKFLKKGRVREKPRRKKPTTMRRIIDRDKLERWIRGAILDPIIAVAVSGVAKPPVLAAWESSDDEVSADEDEGDEGDEEDEEGEEDEEDGEDEEDEGNEESGAEEDREDGPEIVQAAAQAEEQEEEEDADANLTTHNDGDVGVGDDDDGEEEEEDHINTEGGADTVDSSTDDELFRALDDADARAGTGAVAGEGEEGDEEKAEEAEPEPPGAPERRAKIQAFVRSHQRCVRLWRAVHFQVQDQMVRRLARHERARLRLPPSEAEVPAPDAAAHKSNPDPPQKRPLNPGERYRAEQQRARDAALEGLGRGPLAKAAQAAAVRASVSHWNPESVPAALAAQSSSALARFLTDAHGARIGSVLRPHVLCHQALWPELDAHVEGCVTKLAVLQRRVRESASQNAKLRQRLVSGLREVRKNVRAGRCRCVIFAPNVAEVLAAGGLDAALAEIVLECRARTPPVPVVFACTKARLAAAMQARDPHADQSAVKRGPRRSSGGQVSAVAVVDHSGAEAELRSVLSVAASAREQWAMMQCDDFGWTVPDTPSQVPPKKIARPSVAPAADGGTRAAAPAAAAAAAVAAAAAKPHRLNPSAPSYVYHGGGN